MVGQLAGYGGLNGPDVDDYLAAVFGRLTAISASSLADLAVEIDAFARAAGDIKAADAFLIQVIDQPLGAGNIELATAASAA